MPVLHRAGPGGSIVIVQHLDRFQLGPLCRGVVELPGPALFDQGAQGGLRSVLVQNSIDRDLPAAATVRICSYPEL